MVANLWHDLIGALYGEQYLPGKTFNDYVKMHNGIIYKNLSVLFGKTQEQISRMGYKDFEIIENVLVDVKSRLTNLISDKHNDRFFGDLNDPYIWLYEDEIP